MHTIGFDIGTTTLSAVVVNSGDGTVLHAVTVPSEPFLSGFAPYARVQDATAILDRAVSMIDELCDAFAPIAAIGITGQMHGIVYLDKDGAPLGPLYTWQDQRAAQPLANGETTLARIRACTGYTISAGYGLATHTHAVLEGTVPAGARQLCTIHDALSMRLCGKKTPLMHASDAASLGLYDRAAGDFDRNACKALFSCGILPPVSTKTETLGTYRGIPVSLAIGDNQASILGTVGSAEGSVLFNVGTGSQVSVICADPSGVKSGEIRPYIDGLSLVCGCSLCGGRALALLEQFFRSYAALLGHDEPQYPIIDRLAEEIFSLPDPIRFSTSFCGTREDPKKRASIENLSDRNFTPADFVGGVMHGMANELLDYYRSFGLPATDHLYGSGNGIRKSAVLRRLFEDAMALPMQIPAHREEAAYGAALFGAAAASLAPFKTLQANIRYE